MCLRRLPPDALKPEHFNQDLAVYEELCSVTVCCVKSMQIREALQPEEEEKALLKPWHVDALVTALQVILACGCAMGAMLEQVSIIVFIYTHTHTHTHTGFDNHLLELQTNNEQGDYES